MQAIISPPFLLFCFVNISERKLNHVILPHLLRLLFMQLGGLTRLPELALQPNAVLLNTFWKLLNVYWVNLFKGNNLLTLTQSLKLQKNLTLLRLLFLTLEPVLYLLLLLLVSCVVTKLFASTEVIFLYFLIICQFFVLSVRTINVLKGISFILQGQARLHVLFPSLKKCYLNCLIILFSIWFVDFHPKVLPFNILSLILELGKFSARL